MRNEQSWKVLGGERQGWERGSVYENMQQLKETWVPSLLSLAVGEVGRAAAGSCLQSNTGAMLGMGLYCAPLEHKEEQKEKYMEFRKFHK